MSGAGGPPVEVAPANGRGDAAAYDSELQAELCGALVSDGYRVTHSYAVGGHAIDLVVHGPGDARVGILCDGGRPLPDHDLQGVLEHQMILERLGWKLIRIRASEYFRDPKKELERLRRRLGARGVKPVDAERGRGKARNKGERPAEVAEPSLSERVIQRAESIRSRWNIALPPRATEAATVPEPG